ncbi:uncharacterized protein ARMOST_11047 [Armillaria ostoyae]|uniref:Uncharacterized protein n=1 Tax=Armillaria ostoyae TaxID=47428 RepID=A0A284RG20_ARMOS|nr:uncharacterized protein ARMOST_11047 [Armillaria ostoyae]
MVRAELPRPGTLSFTFTDIPILMFSQWHVCRCGHGMHAHADYVSMVVHRCVATNCAAYVQKTPRTQGCTCSASLIDHKPVVNMYRSHATLPYEVDVSNGLPSGNNTFNGNMTNIPFPSTSTHSPSTNDNPSYSYSNAMIFTPTPQPATQTGITQIDAQSHLEAENSYIAQYQNDGPGVNVQESSASFREGPLTTYSTVHGAEAWAGQLE